jgi:hypothetical protein
VSGTVAAVAAVSIVQISSRHYLSSEHLWSSLHHTKIAREIEDAQAPPSRLLEHRSSVTSCVLSAVAFLEALVNEIFSDAADRRHISPRVAPLNEACRTLMSQTWETLKGDRLSILEKFQLALICAGKDKMSTGERPYQDINDLVWLRNALVHFKPAWHDSDAKDSFELRLQHRFLPSPYYAGTGNAWFPHKAISASAAGWASEYVVKFADDWTSRLQLPQTYRSDLKEYGITI